MKRKRPDSYNNLVNLKYYTTVFAVFCIGIITMLLVDNFKESSHWLHFIGEIGAFIAAAIASHFIYDRVIRKDAELLIIEKLENAIEQKFSNTEKDSGIVNSYERFNIDEFNYEVLKAKNRIWILQTWVGNLIMIESSLKEALKRNIEIQILVLNPKSKFCLTRGQELKIDRSDYVPGSINSNLLRLSQIAKEYNYPANFKVRLYDGSYPIIIYGIDDLVYMGLTWREEHTTNSPQLKLRIDKNKENYYSSFVNNHFNSVWKIGLEVNLKQNDW